MPNRGVKLLFLGGLALMTLAAVSLGWWYYMQPTETSVLIADDDLSAKLYNHVLPSDYRILTRVQQWDNASSITRFGRSFECAVVHLEKAPIEREMVGKCLEDWVSQLVTVTSASDDRAEPEQLARILLYETEQTRGEFRYTVEPASGSTPVENENAPTAKHLSLAIQIVEHGKR